MLILTRKSGETITIGDDIKVQVIEIRGKQARLGIEAPKKFSIHREEVHLRILAEERQRRESAESGDSPCPKCKGDFQWIRSSDGKISHWGPGGEQTSSCPSEIYD